MKQSILKQSFVRGAWMASIGAVLVSPVIAAGPADFGAFVENQLRAHAVQLFGVGHPLPESAPGPYTGADSTQAIAVADGLSVSLVSSAVHTSTDMIAMWPDGENPKYLFVCDESSSNPSVQRVDLSLPPNANATTIVTGLSSCDPVRRTPWGSIVVGEETTTGGLYEIMNPASITSPIAVTNRAAGTTTDSRVVKRKAVGQVAWEGNAVLPDGTMIFGDELRPGNGNPGGGIYKFVPAYPYSGAGAITDPTLSPLASGTLYGLRVGNAGDYGQGTEIGGGVWVPVDPMTYSDANGNIVLRNAQLALKFTGYYRPEDMAIDPIAAERGEVRVCFTATGRMSYGGGSAVETAATYGEVMCLTDTPKQGASSGAVATMTRFIEGNPQANYFDNVDFQPGTGNLVVLEDGEVEVVRPDGTTELRGDDLWICLPDGSDADLQSDGCVRFASLTDTDSEPTGFIFDASGQNAYVSLQHRSTGVGALLKISGFKAK